MEISGLLNLQGEMFLLLAAGAMIRKKGILPPAAKGILTDLILYLVLPCNIIHSFRMEFDLGVIKTVLVLIVAAVMIQVLCMVLSRILYNREETGRKKVFQYATLVSNAGFMGNPNAEGVFGAQGLIYASIYLVPQRIVMWTAGIACFTESPDMRSVVKKLYGERQPAGGGQKGGSPSLYRVCVYRAGADDRPASASGLSGDDKSCS